MCCPGDLRLVGASGVPPAPFELPAPSVRPGPPGPVVHPLEPDLWYHHERHGDSRPDAPPRPKGHRDESLGQVVGESAAEVVEVAEPPAAAEPRVAVAGQEESAAAQAQELSAVLVLSKAE